ncbi:hypothetical protein O988_02433 [Pseudogymnoascus sp. VKM F-3808]|nr:hypothetical protein O988_02433 [Pseudogymnoascus sp. VKM F-3808]
MRVVPDNTINDLAELNLDSRLKSGIRPHHLLTLTPASRRHKRLLRFNGGAYGGVESRARQLEENNTYCLPNAATREFTQEEKVWLAKLIKMAKIYDIPSEPPDVRNTDTAGKGLVHTSLMFKLGTLGLDALKLDGNPLARDHVFSEIVSPKPPLPILRPIRYTKGKGSVIGLDFESKAGGTTIVAMR